MKKQRYYALPMSIGMFFIQSLTYGQQANDYINPVQIKSPQTNAFTKYGNVSTNLYNGAIDLKIPIFAIPTYNGENIDVSLSYDSSGFLPHKKSDIAGMNWSLLAGGRITRTVNRIPDEYIGFPTSIGGNPFDTGMNLHGFLTGVRRNPNNNATIYNLNSGAGGVSGLDWRLGPSQDGYEGEPDLFNFSVLGLSGKFMIGNDGKVLVESADPNIKVDISGLTSYAYLGPTNCKPPEATIIITDGKGTKYYFGGDFSKYELAYNYGSPTPGLDAEFNGYAYINSFSISKVEFSDGSIAEFNYVGDTLSDNFCDLHTGLTTLRNNPHVLNFESYAQDGARIDQWRNCPGGGCASSLSSSATAIDTYTLTKRSYLESIKYKNATIKFTYKDIGYPIKHAREELDPLYFNEYVLDHIQVYNNTLLSDYRFWYDNLGGTNKRPFLSKVSEEKSGKIYSMEYYKTDNLPSYMTKGLDHWGYWNSRDNNVSLAPFDTYNDVTGDYTLNNTFRDTDPDKYNTALLSKINYPTKGYTVFEYEPQYYGKRIERNSASSFLPVLTNNNGTAGGARIKKQYDYSENGGIINEKEYKYTSTLEGNTSSGILMNWPRYFYYIQNKSNDNTYNSQLMLKSSSNVQQNSMDSYNIGYQKVYEITKGKGMTEYNFTNYEDFPDTLQPDTNNIRNYFYDNGQGGGYPSYPENLYKNLKNLYGTDKSILRGKVKSEKIYKEGNLLEPIKTVENEYTDNIKVDNSLNSNDENNYVAINHLSGYWVQGYKKYFNSSFLKKTTVTENVNGKILKSILENSYLNSYDHNLSGTTNTYPDGSTSGIRYIYANDLNNFYNRFKPSGYEFVPELASSNMVGIPLVRKNYLNGKFTNSHQTLYNNKLPSQELRYDYIDAENSYQDVEYLPNPSDPSRPILLYYNASYPDLTKAKTELTYDLYDNKANILQYSEKAIKPTVILWGYNQTQPIAKIEGITYAELANKLGFSNTNTGYLSLGVVSASDTDAAQGTAISEQALITALDALRSNPILTGYQITTYSYDPLIGVTSITPPSGIREIYKYDSANRLESVKDVNGNLLKEYQYRYKN
ncbi:hypothetical protein EH151_17700 [Elizabethkingia anophelis]|uniref:hypothetical protein n=1 Tax=Elizabethkingia anophelis TaxID=1117645 RepID=UPI00136B8D11|nr:hypothetical protein [Elizabethkingia anophelis]MYZ61719.1 hypothetical protein [Elizabethkingia anophelis]